MYVCYYAHAGAVLLFSSYIEQNDYVNGSREQKLSSLLMSEVPELREA